MTTTKFLIIIGCTVVMTAIYFESTILQIFSLFMLFDGMNVANGGVDTLSLGDSVCYSEKSILPFMYDYLHETAFKLFHQNMIEATNVNEIHVVNLKEHVPILIKYLNEPIIIRNFSYLLQSEGLLTEKYTKDYWYQKYGKYNISVMTNESCVKDNFETLMNCPNERQMCNSANFNYAQFINASEPWTVNFQSAMLRDNPQLLEMINYAQIQKLFEPKMRVGDIFMTNVKAENNFKVGTMMHRAPLTTSFIQIKGSKQWTFIDPKYSPYLKPYPHYLVRSIYTKSSNGTVEMDANIINYIPRFKVTTYPGDILLFPSLWWHEVVDEKGWNVGIGMRSIDSISTLYQHTIVGIKYAISAVTGHHLSEGMKLMIYGNTDTTTKAEQNNIAWLSMKGGHKIHQTTQV